MKNASYPVTVLHGNAPLPFVIPSSQLVCGRLSVEGTTRRLSIRNVSVTNELSSRPERSVVEGPAVRLVRHQMQMEASPSPLSSRATNLPAASWGRNHPSAPPSRKAWGAPFKPSFGLSGVVADPNSPRCFIRSSLTCLRQVAREMNSLHRRLSTPPHRMRALPYPLSFRAKPRNLQLPLPSIECLGQTVLFIGGAAEGSAVPRTIPGSVFRQGSVVASSVLSAHLDRSSGEREASVYPTCDVPP
jgi:hypothetical protein